MSADEFEQSQVGRGENLALSDRFGTGNCGFSLDTWTESSAKESGT